jgi:hypothetical protein
MFRAFKLSQNIEGLTISGAMRISANIGSRFGSAAVDAVAGKSVSCTVATAQIANGLLTTAD